MCWRFAGLAPARYGHCGRMIPIIDTHQHLWDLQRLRLPWLASLPAIDRTFLPTDYAEAIAGVGIVGAVYVEVDVEPSLASAEADDIVALCEHSAGPTVAAVISARPASHDFTTVVRRSARVPCVKGFRQVLHVPEAPARTCLDARFIRGMHVLGENGKTFDLCMRPDELPDASALIEQCPDTRFVLDHCGNVDVAARRFAPWQRDLERVARHANVVCKVSGLIESASRGTWTADDLAPVVSHVLDVFGPERVLYGSNWPVCTLNGTLRKWTDALRAIVADRPESLQRNLFHDNAVRVYGL